MLAFDRVGMERSALAALLEFVEAVQGHVYRHPELRHVLVLIAGAILSPGQRTVAATSRVAGLDRSCVKRPTWWTWPFRRSTWRRGDQRPVRTQARKHPKRLDRRGLLRCVGGQSRAQP